MSALAALLLAQALPATTIDLTAAVSRPVTSAAPAPDRGERWRIDGEAVTGPDAKTRAAGMTGGQCGIVGARVCTRPPRTWIKAPLGQ